MRIIVQNFATFPIYGVEMGSKHEIGDHSYRWVNIMIKMMIFNDLCAEFCMKLHIWGTLWVKMLIRIKIWKTSISVNKSG